MLTLQQLRKKYRPVSPVAALDDLSVILNHPKKENYAPPLLTVVLTSGYNFKGYLLNASAKDAGEKSYTFGLETENTNDVASDIIYVLGSRIESVTFWNVHNYSGILPRFTDPNPA